MPRINLSDFYISDLKQMRLYITEKGRPTLQLTDIVWQQIIKQIKENIKPLDNGTNKKMIVRSSRAIMNEWGEYEEDQTPDWKRYCLFINSVLEDIRAGEISYCFYSYQIAQLLTFHKDTLQTKYNPIDKFWEVWLDKENNI